MSAWTLACVQMDCRIGDVAGNLAAVRHELSSVDARLVVFPECVLSGYCFDSLDEARPSAISTEGPEVVALIEDCRKLDRFAVVGFLESDGPRVFNSAALIGPGGVVSCYRKLHLPFLGVDRFTTPGDRPFSVHDLGGLRVGMCICYDGSFPETARVLTLLGADLIVLPTNWPMSARGVCELCAVRAMENRVYYVACDRVGEERGWRFKGESRIHAPDGELLAVAGDAPAVLRTEIDPAKARNKRIVRVPGKHEIDPMKDRRPEMYGPITSRSG